MSALARKIHRDEFEQLALETAEPTRPVLQVAAPQAVATRRGLTCRWQIDPVARRLVQVWELRD